MRRLVCWLLHHDHCYRCARPIRKQPEEKARRQYGQLYCSRCISEMAAERQRNREAYAAEMEQKAS